jgi:G3E family GTPase
MKCRFWKANCVSAAQEGLQGVQQIAVNIVTGFLGSGKTSLLQHVLQHGLHKRRVAVVVNDLGDFSLDGYVLQGLDVEHMVALSNGCICCVLSSQFALAMQELLSTVQPELIVIETTGAADPVPLIEEIRRLGLQVDSVVTVVDGMHIRHLYQETVVARQQVHAADFLVLNKCDLLSKSAQQHVVRFLQRHNRRARLVPTTFGQVSADLVFAPTLRDAPASSQPLPILDTPHLHADAIEVMTYTTQRPLHRRAFEQWLSHLPRDLYRVKGIVHFEHDTWSSVCNYTCGRYTITWFKPRDPSNTSSQLVCIGAHLSQQYSDLRAQLAACELGMGLPA